MLVTKLVNILHNDFDVYIGRGFCPKTNKESKWGNPFTHIKDKKTLASEVVENIDIALFKYKNYILNNKELYDSIDELDGKILGCFCVPKDGNILTKKYICHGQILMEIITNKKLINNLKKQNEKQGN